MEVSKINRQQTIATDGVFCHGRNLTQSTNFLQENESPVTFVHGWNVAHPDLKPTHKINALPEEKCQFKKYWDYEPGKYNLKTSGFFSKYIDDKMGISFDDLEGLSVR